MGNAATCQVRLNGPGIMAEHSEIRYQSGGYILKDLGSSVGTRLNNQRILEAPLADGDRIQLGEAEFIFRVGLRPAPASGISPAAVSPGAPASLPAAPAVKPAPEQAARTAAPVPPAPPVYSSRPVSPGPASAPAVPAKRSRRKKVLIGCGVLLIFSLCACAAVSVLASLSSGGSGVASNSSSSSSSTGDLKSALAAKTPDERAEVLARLGLPDAFVISDQTVTGGNVRFESWHYNQFGLRVDFIDGQVAWTVEGEAPPQGSLYPAWYNPLDFEIGMSQEAAASLAAKRSPAGAKPQAIDLAEGGEDLAGATMLAGDQILMGFYNGRLVYVETLALLPEGGAQ